MPEDAAAYEEERARRLAIEAMNYAHHIPGCDYRGGEGVCDCGLRELETAINKLREDRNG